MLLLPAIATALLVGPRQDAPVPEVPVSEVQVPEVPALELLDTAALVERLRALERARGELARVELLGRSRQGREIPVLRLAAGEVARGRPAILVVANLDGPQVFSSALALWQVERLVERFDSDERVRALLEGTTLYVVPRANPDAAAARFATPLAETEGSGHGADDDRDGAQGEDPPADVDGDGAITWMRVPDPEGTWVPDPTDPRASVEADRAKGERGRWRLVREGRDLDGDERVAEDPLADAVVNENFASGWHEHEPRAGRFPMDEPEARALADFVIAHPDVSLVLTYGALDNMVEAPRSVDEPEDGGGRRFRRGPPEPGWLESDAELLAELARRRAEASGREPAGTGSAEGSFQAWVYDHRGLFSLAAALWDVPTDAAAEQEQGDADPAGDGGGNGRRERDRSDEREPGDEAKRLAWCDAQGEQARFKPWVPFEHPELGPVEIGGWMPYARSEPPAAEALEIARGELDFLLSLGAVLPRLELVEGHARALAPGLVEVTATLSNSALLPLRCASGRRARAVRPARVALELPAGAKLVGGPREELVGRLDGAGGRHELRWLVAGEGLGTIDLVAETDHAGSARLSLEVER